MQAFYNLKNYFNTSIWAWFFPRKMKVIHIAQTHKDKLFIKEKKPSPKMIDKVAQSQLQVAIAIQKYPGIPIVSESLENEMRDGQYYEESDQDLSLILSEHMVNQIMKTKIANIFPHGIPTALEQLTVEQRDALYEHGAAMILWFLNKVTILHPCVHSSELKKDMREVFDHPMDIDNPDNPSILEEIEARKILKKVDDLNDRRELEAIECVEVAAYEKYRNLNEGRVLLVYGAAHNFKPYCDARGYKHQYIDCSVKIKKLYSWRNFLLSYGMFSVLMLLGLIIIGIVLTSELGVLTAVATAMVSNLTLPGMILLFVAALGIAFIAGEFIGPYFEGSSEAKVLPTSVSREERIKQLGLNQAEKDRHLKSVVELEATLKKLQKSEEPQPSWMS